jgi:hypothetical protein
MLTQRIADHAIAVSDFDALRTSVLRDAERDAELLELALHALDHGRTEVVAEYIERVRDALRKQASVMRTTYLSDLR